MRPHACAYWTRIRVICHGALNVTVTNRQAGSQPIVALFPASFPRARIAEQARTKL
ncbi:hypothetical protein [Mesorhizobium sp.]|uniref:hypothetical protein n=1 Tax=Mesorhizobium sp. TaxID=1871066 RepID=UPI0026148B18|nr:hypothetical protein [Mesorhizobium sp.]